MTTDLDIPGSEATVSSPDSHPGPGPENGLETGPASGQNPIRQRAGLSLLRLLGTLLAAALLIYLLGRQGWGEVWQAVQRIPPASLGAAVLMMALSRLTVWGRWHVLLRAAGVPVTLWQSLRLTFAGLFATNFLPTTVGGDVVRLAGAVRFGLDGPASAASLLMDRGIGMLGMASLLPLGLPVLWSRPGAVHLPGALAAAPAVPLSGRFTRFARKLRRTANRLLQAFALYLHRPWGLLAALLWTYGHMLCLFFMVGILLDGMGQPLSLVAIGGLWSLNYFISLLPVSINGLGVQEVAIATLYSQFGGVSIEAGLALAVMVRTLYVLASLPGAVCLPGMLGLENRLTENKQNITQA
jgi:uncharacterized membrane protein YbhN (UPF0104 family)